MNWHALTCIIPMLSSCTSSSSSERANQTSDLGSLTPACSTHHLPAMDLNQWGNTQTHRSRIWLHWLFKSHHPFMPLLPGAFFEDLSGLGTAWNSHRHLSSVSKLAEFSEEILDTPWCVVVNIFMLLVIIPHFRHYPECWVIYIYISTV